MADSGENSSTTTSTWRIPYLDDPARRRQFCASYSDGYSSGHRLDVAGQKSMPKAVYEQLIALDDSLDYTITQAEFTMMWRTLLLKRAQDVQEQSTRMRASRRVGITGSLLVPAPLHDLLSSIGEFTSPSLGCRYYTTAPPEPTAVDSCFRPNWFNVSAEILQSWCRVMAAMRFRYAMREFPEAQDYQGKSIILTQRSAYLNGPTGQTSVRSLTNELRPEDGFLHLVNDSLYSLPPVQLHNCHFTVVSRVYEASVRADYVGSYVIDRSRDLSQDESL